MSDVTKIGRYSPETFEAEWLEGATGPAVGAKFRGHVKRNGIGPIYWTTCTVRGACPGRTSRSASAPADKPLNIWGYRLEPSGDGTDVTESRPGPHRLSASTGRVMGWARAAPTATTCARRWSG